MKALLEVLDLLGPLFLLMGKKCAEPFKEKPFMPASLFFGRVGRRGAALFLPESAILALRPTAAS